MPDDPVPEQPLSEVDLVKRWAVLGRPLLSDAELVEMLGTDYSGSSLAEACEWHQAQHDNPVPGDPDDHLEAVRVLRDAISFARRRSEQ